MRLLVTRPEPDAARTAARLRDMGHEPLVEPLLVTEILPGPIVGRPAALVVTSRNGVRAVASWGQSMAWRALPVFAVGDATAMAATAAGFIDVRSAAGDASALADLIVSTRDRPAGPILYAAAADRLPALEDRLRIAGLPFDTVVAYRTVPAPELTPHAAAAIGGRSLDGILLYSARTASALLDAAGRAGLTDALSSMTVLAISQATADILRTGAVRQTLVAATPDEDAMMQLVNRFAGTEH